MVYHDIQNLPGQEKTLCLDLQTGNVLAKIMKKILNEIIKEYVSIATRNNQTVRHLRCT